MTLAAVAACSRSGADEPVPASADAARSVRVAAVADTNVARPIVGTGTLGARDELDLSFKIGGVVARVAVDAGDRVRKGQLLATLERAEIDAGVAKARSALDKAERDAERLRRLWRDSVVALAQYQDAETALEVARADLRAVTFDQRYATIVAPAAGTVLRRLANPGELVSPGTGIVSFASAARGTVLRVGLPDRDVVRVRRGDRATVRFDAYPDRVFTGRVEEIAAAATPATGTYAVEVRLTDAPALPTGLVGRAEIAPREARPVRLVPVEAIVEADGDRGTVYVLADSGRAERREVGIAFTDGARVAISSGLDDARQVVTDGAPYLDDGDAVRVAP